MSLWDRLKTRWALHDAPGDELIAELGELHRAKVTASRGVQPGMAYFIRREPWEREKAIRAELKRRRITVMFR